GSRLGPGRKSSSPIISHSRSRAASITRTAVVVNTTAGSANSRSRHKSGLVACSSAGRYYVSLRPTRIGQTASEALLAAFRFKRERMASPTACKPKRGGNTSSLWDELLFEAKVVV